MAMFSLRKRELVTSLATSPVRWLLRAPLHLNPRMAPKHTTLTQSLELKPLLQYTNCVCTSLHMISHYGIVLIFNAQ